MVGRRGMLSRRLESSLRGRVGWRCGLKMLILWLIGIRLIGLVRGLLRLLMIMIRS